MSFIERLAPLRTQPGTRLTTGLDDATLTALSVRHPQLIAAVDAAAEEFARVQADLGPLLTELVVGGGWSMLATLPVGAGLLLVWALVRRWATRRAR